MNSQSRQHTESKPGKKNGFRIKPLIVLAVAAAGALMSGGIAVAQQPALPKFTIGMEPVNQPADLAVTLQVILLLTVLTLAPSILMMTTSFVRIVIAFHFVRQALGVQGLPPNQVIIGLSLFMTLFIMSPVITEIYDNAWKPYAEQKITLQMGWERAQDPLREFMLKHTREKDLQLFTRLANVRQPGTQEEVPMRIVIPAFITSEMRVGFQIGFMIYMPMLIIDMVVASVLMSMGMMMLPPVMLSLPFKLLMFVLVDGWYLVVQSLVESFQ